MKIKLTKAQAEVIYRIRTEMGYGVGAAVRIDEVFPGDDNRDIACCKTLVGMARTGEFVKRERFRDGDYYSLFPAALDAFDNWKLPYLLKSPYTIPF